MRAVIDSEVKKYFENRPFETETLREFQRRYSGDVEKINEFEYMPTSKAQSMTLRERLLSSMTRMPGTTNQEKYCFAMMSLANLGSIYLSTTMMYAMYAVLTKEVKPVSVVEFIKDAGQGHILSSLDMDVLSSMIKDVLKGYESLADKKPALLEAAESI